MNILISRENFNIGRRHEGGRRGGRRGPSDSNELQAILAQETERVIIAIGTRATCPANGSGPIPVGGNMAPGDTGTRRPLTRRKNGGKRMKEAKQRLQALQTSLRQCRGSQVLPPDNRSALENPDALPVKERAARVEQQHRSFAGIEKQQAERVAVLEEQVAAEKLRLQKTKLNIQQAQQETDRIALLVAAQTAADELGRPPSRRIHGQRAGGPRYRTCGGKISRAPSRDDDADPSRAGRQCLPHCLQEDQPQDFHTRLAEFWPTRQTTQSGGTSDATDHLEWRALSGPVPLALAEMCDPPEPVPAPFPDCKLWKTRSPFCHDSSALA